MRRNLVTALFLIAIPILANSAGQTDWSGGPGVPGPVAPWGNAFLSGSNIDYDTTPGILTLASPYGSHLVESQTQRPNSSTIADFNGDGLLDIAAVTTEGVYWWENENQFGFDWTRHTIDDASDSRSWTLSYDFDKDGDVDIAASLYGNGLYWWKNNGSGSSWTQYTIQTADTRGCCLGDFDNDGWMDIGLTVVSTADVLWWRNKLGTTNNWSVNYVDGSLLGAFTIDALDMNGTGGVDIVASSYSTGATVLYINNLGSWERKTIASPGSDIIRCIRIADIDSNELLDVVVASPDGLYWWENVNWTFWTLHTIDGTYNPYGIAIADLDADGYDDVLAANWAYGSNGELRWYRNEELGAVWTLVDDFVSPTTYDISVGDINGDGIPDAVTTSSTTPATIQQYRFGGYDSPGAMVSTIYDTGAINQIIWDYLHWDAEEPDGTNLRVAIRGSDDAAAMGPWSDWISEPIAIGSLLESTDRYIQYQLDLTTTSPWVAPVLNDITFLWHVTGIEGDPEGVAPLALAGSNPAFGDFQLDFAVPVAGQASLDIFDLSGRVVARPVSGVFESGTYSSLVSGLPSGIYVCVFNAPGISASLQVAVVR